MLNKEGKKREKVLEQSIEGKIPPRAEGKAPYTILKTRLAKVFHPKVMGTIWLFVIWEIASLVTPENLFPNPYVVFQAVIFGVILREGFLFHVRMTVLRIIIGFCISFSIGMSIGVLMGAKRFWEEFFTDYVIIGLTIPSLAWAVIGVLWLGLRPLTPVFATAMIVFPYVAINFWEGVKDVDKDLVDMGRAFDVSKRRIIRHIYIPSIVPFTLAAARIGFSISWKIVIVGEVFGASNGIGYMIYYWYNMFSMRLVLAWLLFFTVVMLLVEYSIFKRLERRLLAWRPQAIL
ncbi:MAG: ABC transporter permease [Thermodesulfobacteriota bacterium]